VRINLSWDKVESAIPEETNAFELCKRYNFFPSLIQRSTNRERSKDAGNIEEQRCFSEIYS